MDVEKPWSLLTCPNIGILRHLLDRLAKEGAGCMAANGMFEKGLSAEYVIPKPMDPRVVPRVARYVAEAAIAEGIAQKPISDLSAYEQSVRSRIASR